MNSQDTPVHIHLWHRDFWYMVIASLLLTMSVYMLLPVMPRWLMEEENFTPAETGLSMGVFALGLYLFGAHCSWLVQHYRRNQVAMAAMVSVALAIAFLWYLDGQRSAFCGLWVVMAQRFVLGAVYGLAQMVMSSTLIIDTCESSQRTVANHSASWVSRFALSLGPLSGLLTAQYLGFDVMLLGATGIALVSVLLVGGIDFPFRSPEENVRMLSLDRFFLPHGSVLFLNYLLVSVVVGMIFSLPLDGGFYAFMSGGLLMALVAQSFVFRDAELKSEIITGLFLLIAAQLVLLGYPLSPVAPILIGLGVGIIASRFLLFFIKLSRHCQRGTSQSTSLLAWETGLSVGLGVGYGLFYQRPVALLHTSLVMAMAALLMYHLYTHQWFVRNKNR